jgi:hypothetical protein
MTAAIGRVSSEPKPQRCAMRLTGVRLSLNPLAVAFFEIESLF